MVKWTPEDSQHVSITFTDGDTKIVHILEAALLQMSLHEKLKEVADYAKRELEGAASLQEEDSGTLAE